MKVNCPDCGHEYQLGQMLLSVCTECLNKTLKHPFGIKYKHATEQGAFESLAKAIAKGRGNNPVSYILPGVDPGAIIDYMSNGTTLPDGSVSGCHLYLNKKHNSINAYSYFPLGQIPGSGITEDSQFAAQYAIFCDIEGKSNDKQHFFFEHKDAVLKSIKDGNNIICPPCRVCGIARWRPGEPCPYCAKS